MSGHLELVCRLPGSSFGGVVQVRDASGAPNLVVAAEADPSVLPRLLAECHGLLLLPGMNEIADQPELLLRLSRTFGPEVEKLSPYRYEPEDGASGRPGNICGLQHAPGRTPAPQPCPIRRSPATENCQRSILTVAAGTPTRAIGAPRRTCRCFWRCCRCRRVRADVVRRRNRRLRRAAGCNEGSDRRPRRVARQLGRRPPPRGRARRQGTPNVGAT